MTEKDSKWEWKRYLNPEGSVKFTRVLTRKKKNSAIPEPPPNFPPENLKTVIVPLNKHLNLPTLPDNAPDPDRILGQ